MEAFALPLLWMGKDKESLFSFHSPLNKLVYHMPHSVHTKIGRCKTKDEISNSLCLISLWGI